MKLFKVIKQFRAFNKKLLHTKAWKGRERATLMKNVHGKFMAQIKTTIFWWGLVDIESLIGLWLSLKSNIYRWGKIPASRDQIKNSQADNWGFTINNSSHSQKYSLSSPPSKYYSSSKIVLKQIKESKKKSFLKKNRNYSVYNLDECKRNTFGGLSCVVIVVVACWVLVSHFCCLYYNHNILNFVSCCIFDII